MRWPFVSRRAFDLIEDALTRALKERDEYRDQVQRATDMLIHDRGFAPVSTEMRTELKEFAAAQAQEMEYDMTDPSGGMLEEELIDEVARALGTEPN